MEKRKAYFGKKFDVKEFYGDFIPREGIEKIETKHIAKYLGYKTSDPITRLLYDFGFKKSKGECGEKKDYRQYTWDKEKIIKFAEKYNSNKYKKPKQPKLKKGDPPKNTIKKVIEKMCIAEKVKLDEKSLNKLVNRIEVYCRESLRMEVELYNDGKYYYNIDKKTEKIIRENFKWNGEKFKLPYHQCETPKSGFSLKYGYEYGDLITFIEENDSFRHFIEEGKSVYIYKYRSDYKLRSKFYQFIKKNIEMGNCKNFPDFYEKWEKDDGKEIIAEYTAKK